MALDWDKLRIFHAAAEAGSFTHAADKLHLSQSAISRQVSALEQDFTRIQSQITRVQRHSVETASELSRGWAASAHGAAQVQRLEAQSKAIARLRRETQQRLDDLVGKIVCITSDGAAPPDNPFVGRSDARPEIYAFGVRNPQGLARNPWTGAIWEQEHGPRGAIAQRVQRLKRETGALAAGPKRAEHAGARGLQLAEEDVGVGREQLRRSLAGARPDDRAAAVDERQERERSARQESLPRRLAMRQRSRHVRDDGCLPIAV